METYQKVLAELLSDLTRQQRERDRIHGRNRPKAWKPTKMLTDAATGIRHVSPEMIQTLVSLLGEEYFFKTRDLIHAYLDYYYTTGPGKAVVDLQTRLVIPKRLQTKV